MKDFFTYVMIMKISIFRVALKNLRKKLFRNISIMLAAALATGLIFAATTILQSVESSLVLGMERLGADIMVVPEGSEENGNKLLLGGTPTTFYMPGDRLPMITAVKGVEKASPQLFVKSAVLQCCSMPTVLLVGYDPDTDFTITPWERYQHHTSDADGIDLVTIGANTLYATEGALMTFFGKQFRIGTSTHPTGMGFLDYSIFMTMDAARDMIETSRSKSDQPLTVDPEEISSILVRLDPGADVVQVVERIESAVPGVKAIVTKDLISSVRDDVEGSLWGIIAAGAASWLMTVFLMGTVFTMVVNERQREIGLLRAMGATRKHVIRLIISEAFVIALLGGLLGVGAGWIIIENSKLLIIESLGKTTFLWPSPVFIGLVAVGSVVAIIVSGAATAIYPAIKSSFKDPYEAIRGGR